MKISVITVCYNSAATIKDTLESVELQRYKNFEHLIVDGGSTDGTLEIVRAWKGHPIRLVSESDEGLYDAMNKGLTLASGEVLGFLNSDDFYADSSVLEQIAKAFQNKSLDACYADLVYVSCDNRRVLRYWQSKPFTRGAFALGWCPAHPTFYVRKAVVDKYGCFDRSFKLAADAELMMRYLERGKINSTYIPYVWVRMRIGGQTNKSLKNINQQNKEILIALEKNDVPFSKILFVTNKIINRILQFIFGRIKQSQ
jgi:glycosyltransferase involved in cell wall biosynthesis